MANLFFRASEDALDNITEAFDIVHPLRASVRFTRKTLNEHFSGVNNVDDIACQQLIDSDMYIHGVNYQRAFFEKTFDDYEERLAWMLLNNLFAIHEGWVDRLYSEFFDNQGYNKKTFQKNLEYESLLTKMSTYFVPNAKKSMALTNAFFTLYQNKSHLDFTKLDNYMLCYRYFKEARNCYMHKNFIASKQLIGSYNNFMQIATTSALDVSEVPITIPPRLNQPVEISIRGVIGFSQIVQRIIIICDAYLLTHQLAEKEIYNRRYDAWKLRPLSRDAVAAKKQVTRYCTKSGLLNPVQSTDFYNLLIRVGVFS